jgi:hypothetical protein
MQKIVRLATLLTILFLFTGCAGVPVPFTDYRLGEYLVESDRKERNNSCTDLKTLNEVSLALETQHLVFIQSQDEADAITAGTVKKSLGEACLSGLTRLSTPQIKNELFGDIQTISDSSKLRELGGLAFEFRGTVMHSGIEVTLHLQRRTEGPKRRLVAIYRLNDGKVIHFNYSGTDNVDMFTRFWPIREFFGLAVKGGTKAATGGIL